MVVLEFRLPDFKGIHLMIKLSCLPALKCSHIIYTFLCSTPKRPPRAHTIRLFSHTKYIQQDLWYIVLTYSATWVQLKPTLIIVSTLSVILFNVKGNVEIKIVTRSEIADFVTSVIMNSWWLFLDLLQHTGPHESGNFLSIAYFR